MYSNASTMKKGKERKKGQKEINKDNEETLGFYLKFTVLACSLQALHVLLFSWLSGFTWWRVFLILFAGVHHAGAHWVLNYLTKSGLDLATTWISEYSKDVLIFTSILQLLSSISSKVWFFWLLMPGYAFYKVWVLLLWPWFTAGSEPLSDEEQKGHRKKQRVKYVKAR